MEDSKIVEKKTYKYCIVPLCHNSTIKTPHKLFFSVPKDDRIRRRWCSVMKRDENKNKKLSSTSSLFCCEDHFLIGKNIEKHSYIVDLEGYTFRQAANRDAINMLNEILKLYEANYPDRMKIVYFINAPVHFNWVLNFSKPFISENTLKKFRMYGKDFKNALLGAIDAEILPKFLGGTRKDPDGDPMCKTIINYGGMIPPEKYVINGVRESLVGKEGVTSLKVPSQSHRLVEIRVEEPNNRVEWLFETSAKDIAVGLYRRVGPREEDLQEILPTERVNSHLVPESGAFLCHTPGTYVLKFDNSYSWMIAKKVFYQIKVVPAAENDTESDYD